MTVALQDIDVRAGVLINPRTALFEDNLRSAFDRRLVLETGARITVGNLDGRRAAVVL